MIGGIIDGFFMPARLLASLIIDEVASFPRGFQTVYHKLGMILGIVLFLGLSFNQSNRKKKL